MLALSMVPLFGRGAEAVADAGYKALETTEECMVWYLAEGYTGGEFDTWVLVQNPGDTEAEVLLRFQLPPGQAAEPYYFKLPAGTRQSIHLDELPGLEATDVSTTVSSTQPVVAERAMYFNYEGKPGGHDSVGIKYPSCLWFLAEGYTGGEFDTWVLVQNPTSAATTVTLDFQLPPGASAPSYQFDLPAGARQSVHLDTLPGLEATDVSTRISSPISVVAERSVYFNYDSRITGGHNSTGLSTSSASWYLAEGYTGGEFDTWVLVQNPGDTDARVTLDFQLPPGTSAPSYSFDLPAGTRQSVHLDTLPGLEATDVSTTVSATSAVVAERAMYFNCDGRIDGHDSVGTPYPQADWYLAEGYTGGEFDTWVLVQNPGATEKTVTLHFQLPPGSAADDYTFSLPAGTRQSVHLDTLPGLEATDVSTWVEAGGPVVAERAMYFVYDGRIGGGSCSIGALYEPAIIPSTTVVLDGDDMKLLEDDQGSADAVHRYLTFSANTANLDKVDVGDVVVSASYSQMPGGILAKVSAVDRTGGKVILTCVAAGLEEALIQGRISSTGLGAAGASYKSGGVFPLHISQTMPFDYTVGTSSNNVRLAGSLTLGCDLDFNINVSYTPPDIDVSWHTRWGIPYVTVDATAPSVSLNNIGFGASFTEQVVLDATAHGDFNIDEFVATIPGTRVFIPANGISFAIGPVPVVLAPYVQLAVGADGHVKAEVTAGLTQNASLSAGVTYDNGTGWHTSKGFSYDYDFRPPDDSATFSQSDLKVGVGPQIGVLLYAVAGPYINVLPGYRMTLNTDTGHPGMLWALYVNFSLDIGVKVGLEMAVGYSSWSFNWTLSIVNEKYRLYDDSWLLANRVVIYSLTPAEGGEGTAVTIAGWGFGGSRENSSHVDFGSTPVVDADITSWSDTQIKCKVPPGLNGAVNVTVTHVFWELNIGIYNFTISQTSNKKPFLVNYAWQKTLGGDGSDGARDIVQVADGYVVAGTKAGDGWLFKLDLQGNLVWENAYGGDGDDSFYSLIAVSGGFVASGWTSSSGAGGWDAWLVGVDTSGNQAWSNAYGGAWDDSAACVRPAADGGYIFVGRKGLSDTNADGWLVKTDSLGNKSWDKNFGSAGSDFFYSLAVVSDGYVMAGSKYIDGDYHHDGWLLKTNLSGTKSWEKTFSGPDAGAYDVFNSVQSVSGGFVVAGTKNVSGMPQGWLVKTDTAGNQSWDQTYGGGTWMMMECVRQTTDGGYILAGPSGSGNMLATLLKTDASGNQSWKETYSDNTDNDFYSVIVAADQGYAAVGYTFDYDTNVYDALVVKEKKTP